MRKVTVTKRAWPALDAHAAKQLNAKEGSAIFLMSIQLEYIDDAIEELESEDCEGICGADAISIIEKNIVRVRLPKGMCFVGMAEFGVESTPVYGIVSFPEENADANQG